VSCRGCSKNHEADITRIRRRDEDSHWGTSFNQTSNGVPSRSIPDYDGRRRYRSRNANRTASQAASRSNGPNSARSNRNSSYHSGPLRTPAHSSNPSFDENITSQRRSVTPHPTITSTPIWSSPPQAQTTAAGRPSSLPTERSPLGEASEVRDDSTTPRSPNGNNTISQWQGNNTTSGTLFHNWVTATTSNGRPVSATFINEMPNARLQQPHQYHMSNSTEAEFTPHMGAYMRR
jgi:hypothetical protein